MEEFEVLSVTHFKDDENIQKEFENRVLDVKVQYKNEFISFFYKIDSEKQWIFQGNTRILSDLNSKKPFYHFHIIDTKKRKGTFEEFQEKMNDLAPKILNHPKVRIKAVLHK